MKDRRLARIVQRCQALPGEDLFQYLDDQGDRQTIGSGDVNGYLRAVSGEEFTAKDFRQQHPRRMRSTTFTPQCWMPIPAAPCSKPSRMERERRHWKSTMPRWRACCERLCSEQPAPASPQQLSPSWSESGCAHSPGAALHTSERVAHAAIVRETGFLL